MSATPPVQNPSHVCKNCGTPFELAEIARGKTLTVACCDKPSLMPINYRSDSLMKRLALQKAEFDAADAFAKEVRRIQLTPVVDDDYPAVRECYEFALMRLIQALKKNGRFV